MFFNVVSGSEIWTLSKTFCHVFPFHVPFNESLLNIYINHPVCESPMTLSSVNHVYLEFFSSI